MRWQGGAATPLWGESERRGYENLGLAPFKGRIRLDLLGFAWIYLDSLGFFGPPTDSGRDGPLGRPRPCPTGGTNVAGHPPSNVAPQLEIPCGIRFPTPQRMRPMTSAVAALSDSVANGPVLREKLLF